MKRECEERMIKQEQEESDILESQKRDLLVTPEYEECLTNYYRQCMSQFRRIKENPTTQVKVQVKQEDMQDQYEPMDVEGNYLLEKEPVKLQEDFAEPNVAYIQDIKARHIYIHGEEHRFKGKQLGQFLKERQICVVELRRIISLVGREMQIYYAYFNEAMDELQNDSSKQQKIRAVYKDIQFLKMTFQQQNSQIDSLVPGERIRFLKRYITGDNFRVTKKLLSECLLAQSSKETVKKETEDPNNINPINIKPSKIEQECDMDQ